MKEEVGTTLHHLIASLQEIVKGVKRREALLMHVTTAVVSSASTAGLLMYFLPNLIPDDVEHYRWTSRPAVLRSLCSLLTMRPRRLRSVGPMPRDRDAA